MWDVVQIHGSPTSWHATILPIREFTDAARDEYTERFGARPEEILLRQQACWNEVAEWSREVPRAGFR